ncbi:MAG: phosphodiester glycosidase family protein [Erythrobacter sp.]
MIRVMAAAATLLALAGCGIQGGEPVTRTEIGGKKLAQGKSSPTPAPRTDSACRAVEYEGVPLTHCVADPARHSISTMLADPSGKLYRSLATYAAALGNQAGTVAFAVNAGMYDEEGKPIGYYVERGERLKELNRADGEGNFHLKPNGVFFGSEGKWQVRTADDFYANVGDRPQFGTQSGPMLLIAGKLHPELQDDGPSRAIRNGVGVDAQGKAHFVISDAPVSFGQLARFFRDELKVQNALYLDGSISALWDPPSQRLDSGPPIGPLIVVTKRATAAP